MRRLIIPIIPGGGIFSPVPPVTEPCFPEGWFPVGTFDEPQLGCAAMARVTQRAQAGCQNGFRTPPHNPQMASGTRSDGLVTNPLTPPDPENGTPRTAFDDMDLNFEQEPQKPVSMGTRFRQRVGRFIDKLTG